MEGFFADPLKEEPLTTQDCAIKNLCVMLKSMVYGAHLYNLHFTFLATFPHNFSRENIPPDPKNVITMMSVIIDTELQIIVC